MSDIDIIVRPPVLIRETAVGGPVTLNATLGQAGLWTGEGPPGTIVGAEVSDEYLDITTGDLYRLYPGV